MDIGQVFDELVADYSQRILRWVPNYQLMLETLVQSIPKSFAPKQILELGCGNRNLTSLMAHKYPNTHFTAVDLSADMIASCRRRLDKHSIHFEQSWIQDFSAPSNSFDMVCAALALHHLEPEDKENLFHRAYDWLRPGGIFLIADLLISKTDRPFHDQHLKYWKVQAIEYGTTLEEWENIMAHYDEYDRPDDWLLQIKWLKKTGFSKVDTPLRKLGWTVMHAKK